MKAKWMVVVAGVMAMLALSGCNTMSGVGKDIERGGEKLQGEAKK